MCFTHLRQRRRCHERDCSTARTILPRVWRVRSEEHTSELQSRLHLVCRLLLEKKKSPPPPPAHRDITTHHSSLMILAHAEFSSPRAPLPSSALRHRVHFCVILLRAIPPRESTD